MFVREALRDTIRAMLVRDDLPIFMQLVLLFFRRLQQHIGVLSRLQREDVKYFYLATQAALEIPLRLCTTARDVAFRSRAKSSIDIPSS